MAAAPIRSPLPMAVLALLTLALGGCAGTPFGETLSGSFSNPPAPPTANPPPRAAPARPATRPQPAGSPTPVTTPAAGSPQAAPSPLAPSTTTAPTAKPTNRLATPVTRPAKDSAPYRVTLRLPQADPAAPAEALTQALRAAGVPFVVERIENVPGTNTPTPGTAAAPAPTPR